MKINALNSIPTVRVQGKLQNNKTQNNPNEKTLPKDFKELLNYQKSYRPSFCGIEDHAISAAFALICASVLALKGTRAIEDIPYTTHLKSEIKSSIKETAEKLEVSQEEAEAFLTKVLESIQLPVKGNGNEDGLNAVVGSEGIKYGILTNYISPIVMSQNNPSWYPTDDMEVPNGMLLEGFPTGPQSYILDKTCEHLEKLGVNIIDIEQRGLNYFDHEENADIIDNIFEEARKLYKEKGIRTVIRFDTNMSHFFSDRRKHTDTIPEVSAFLNNAENCSEEGVSWIGWRNNYLIDANYIRDIDSIDKAILRKGRTDLKYTFQKPSTKEVENYIKYSLLGHGIKDTLTLERLDFGGIARSMKRWEVYNQVMVDLIIEHALKKNDTASELLTTETIINEISNSEGCAKYFRSREILSRYQKREYK